MSKQGKEDELKKHVLEFSEVKLDDLKRVYKKLRQEKNFGLQTTNGQTKNSYVGALMSSANINADPILWRYKKELIVAIGQSLRIKIDRSKKKHEIVEDIIHDQLQRMAVTGAPPGSSPKPIERTGQNLSFHDLAELTARIEQLENQNKIIHEFIEAISSASRAYLQSKKVGKN